mgnify:CR=1
MVYAPTYWPTESEIVLVNIGFLDNDTRPELFAIMFKVEISWNITT